MNTTKARFIVIITLFAAACSSSKKGTAPSAKDKTAVVGSAPTAPKSENGAVPPGNEELTAIRTQYNDATLKQLQEGHLLYTTGGCVGCHKAKNINRYAIAKWKDIMDDMAKRAKLSIVQKESVYRYVLAIKAVQANTPK